MDEEIKFDYYACPKCGYRITGTQYRSIKFELKCPRCYNKTGMKLRHFIGRNYAKDETQEES